MKLFPCLALMTLALLLPTTTVRADDPPLTDLDSILEMLEGCVADGNCESSVVVRGIMVGPDGEVVELDVDDLDFGDFDLGDIDFGDIDFDCEIFGDPEALFGELDFESLLEGLDFDGICEGLGDIDFSDIDFSDIDFGGFDLSEIDGMQCQVSTIVVGPNGEVIESEGNDLSEFGDILEGLDLEELLGNFEGLLGNFEASVQAVVVGADGEACDIDIEDFDIEGLLGELEILEESMQEFMSELLDD